MFRIGNIWKCEWCARAGVRIMGSMLVMVAMAYLIVLLFSMVASLIGQKPAAKKEVVERRIELAIWEDSRRRVVADFGAIDVLGEMALPIEGNVNCGPNRVYLMVRFYGETNQSASGPGSKLNFGPNGSRRSEILGQGGIQRAQR